MSQTPTLPKAVVVDDDPVSLCLMSAALDHAGFLVIEATDGEEGWKAILAESPDVIVTDLNMPHMSGIELFAKVQHILAEPVPVIVCSSLIDPADFASTKIPCLAKPINIVDLAQMATEQLQIRRMMFPPTGGAA